MTARGMFNGGSAEGCLITLEFSVMKMHAIVRHGQPLAEVGAFPLMHVAPSFPRKPRHASINLHYP